MVWIKFDTSTPDKPEVWQIASDLGIDPDAVVGKLLRVWSWFDLHTEDGNAPIVTKVTLDRHVGNAGFCDAMVRVGWLVEKDGAISVANFDRHNGETAKNRALTAKRVQKHKRKGNDAGNGNGVTSALPREEKIREDKREESAQRSRGSRLPSDWTLTDELINAAKAIRADWTDSHIRYVADQFRDYWTSQPGSKGVKLDWLATWRNWCRNDRSKPNAGPSGTEPSRANNWLCPEGTSPLELPKDDPRRIAFDNRRVVV